MNITFASKDKLASENIQVVYKNENEFVVDEATFSEAKQTVYLAGLETLHKQERIGDFLSIAVALSILALLSVVISRI